MYTCNTNGVNGVILNANNTPIPQSAFGNIISGDIIIGRCIIQLTAGDVVTMVSNNNTPFDTLVPPGAPGSASSSLILLQLTN
jgi:hypothetical protein